MHAAKTCSLAAQIVTSFLYLSNYPSTVFQSLLFYFTLLFVFMSTGKAEKSAHWTCNTESASAASQAPNLCHCRTQRMCAILFYTRCSLFSCTRIEWHPYNTLHNIKVHGIRSRYFLVQNAKRSFRVTVYLRNFSVFPFGICWRVQCLFSILLYYSIVVCPIHAWAWAWTWAWVGVWASLTPRADTAPAPAPIQSYTQ